MDYAEQGYFLVYYNYDVGALGDLVPPERPDIPNDGCDTVVARFRVTGDRAWPIPTAKSGC
ncbi:MAG: hypothetical protein R3A10_09165 [Caldilineaceae bacterium]